MQTVAAVKSGAESPAIHQDSGVSKAIVRSFIILVVSLVLGACDVGGGAHHAHGSAQAGKGDAPPVATAVDDLTAFKQTVYVELVDYCSTCHAGKPASVPAFSHADVAVAYDVITKKNLVDLQNPAKSRIVVKLTQEKHNCWSGASKCADDALVIQQSIEAWLALVGKSPAAINSLDAQTLRSASTSFAASAGSSALKKRVSTGLLALYTFREGSGVIIHDVSGVAPAMDLTLSGMEWLPGQGVKNVSGMAISTVTDSVKLFDAIAGSGGSGQYTVEAWLVADNTTQNGPARTVTYGIDTGNRNFMLGQAAAEWAYRNRSLAAGITANGSPNLVTSGGAVKTELTHVVMTFEQTNGRKIYLNGADTGLVDPQGPGAMSNWNNTYPFVVGNEKTNDRLWKGEIYLVAVYRSALSAAEVKQNFDAGFKDRTVLSFDIGGLSGVAGSTIVIEAGEIDKASYVFTNPTYIGPQPENLLIQGMQIAINDTLPAVGQAYRNVDVTVNAAEQLLSPIGTVMAKDKGKDSDSFMLVFAAIGTKTNILSEPAPAALALITDERSVVPDAGVRTFDQINDTMSTLTGVAQSTAAVVTVFNQINQALPGGSNIMSFLPAQQIAIAKLATEYCNAMTDNTTLRNNFFGSSPAAFEFGSVVSTAFGSQAKKDRITNALISGMIGVNLASQPTQSEAYNSINSLLNDLIAANPAGDATRTRAIVKGACTAVLSSAALMVR